MADSRVPDLPVVDAESFPVSLRDKVREAYAAVLATPESAAANGKLGMILQACKPSDPRAEVCYQRARRSDPNSFRWAYYLALVQAAGGNYAEAIPTIREALRLNPGYLSADLKLGEWLLASGNAREARTVLEVVVRRHPDSAQTVYTLGRARAAMDDLPGAVEAYRRACELFPEFGPAHYALGIAYRQLNDLERARKEMALYKARKYEIPGVADRFQAELNELYIKPGYLLDVAQDFDRQGKLEPAVAANEKALEFDPALARAHVNLISLYGRLHQYEKAEEHYRLAVALDANAADGHYNYGVMLMRLGRYRDAESAFGKAVAADPDHADARNNLGDVFQRQRRFSEAESEFRKAIASRPEFPQAHFNLGRLLVNRGRYNEGIQELHEAVRTGEQNTEPAYLYALGAAYVRGGYKNEGAQCLREARGKAAAQRQTQLLESIDRDLQKLGGPSER
ncbi:MAG: tetratricopeptide repeat protein [Bryobacteraceae bacterium]